MRPIFTILVLLFFTQLQAQPDIPILPNLVGDDLLEEVLSAYKPTTVLDYGPARDILYGTIYSENDSVTCVYTGHTLHVPPGVDPSSHLYMNGSADGINCEHTYPRSKGADEDNGNSFSDMHHLFPTRTSVNASRSNHGFGEINDNQTMVWFYLNQTQNNIPITNVDSYSESINGTFEPREVHKGNVARAVFYFFAMYEADALDADPDFFESQREILCDWHSQDPVDSMEWKRTYMIAEYQNDLPNPFVLDSTLAARSFCGGATAIEELMAEPEILIYPNPVIDSTTITAAGNNNVQVIDVLGRIFIRKQFSNSIELDLSNLNSGTYSILVNEKVFRVMKL